MAAGLRPGSTQSQSAITLSALESLASAEQTLRGMLPCLSDTAPVPSGQRNLPDEYPTTLRHLGWLTTQPLGPIHYPCIASCILNHVTPISHGSMSDSVPTLSRSALPPGTAWCRLGPSACLVSAHPNPLSASSALAWDHGACMDQDSAPGRGATRVFPAAELQTCRCCSYVDVVDVGGPRKIGKGRAWVLQKRPFFSRPCPDGIVSE